MRGNYKIRTLKCQIKFKTQMLKYFACLPQARILNFDIHLTFRF